MHLRKSSKEFDIIRKQLEAIKSICGQSKIDFIINLGDTIESEKKVPKEESISIFNEINKIANSFNIPFLNPSTIAIINNTIIIISNIVIFIHSFINSYTFIINFFSNCAIF